MKTDIAPDTDIRHDDTQGWDTVQRRMNDILSYLKTLEEKKDAEITALRKELQECRQAGEGTRQLINKLLNDIDNYRKDIIWYQRTYETRSLPGAIWQKLLRKRRSKT